MYALKRTNIQKDAILQQILYIIIETLRCYLIWAESLNLFVAREYWIIYRVLSFLAVVWFCSPDPPLPSVSSTGDIEEDWKREPTCWQERGRVWRESLVILKSVNIELTDDVNGFRQIFSSWCPYKQLFLYLWAREENLRWMAQLSTTNCAAILILTL